MFGSTLDSGVISAPDSAASPLPIANVTSRTRALLMPSPWASVSFMMTARVERPRRVPPSRAVKTTATITAAAIMTMR